MATNTLNRYSLLTILKETYNNELIPTAEVLNETNDIVQDMPLLQANDITSHVVGRVTSLPQPQWTKIGDGWDSSNSTTQQVREPISQIKSRVQIIEDLVDIAPDPNALRTREENRHAEAIGQSVANMIISGTSASAPEKIDGLATRLSSITAGKVFNNGSSGGSTSTSIYLVQWGPGKVYGIYPRNSKSAGLERQDMGKQMVTGANSKMMWAYITEMKWRLGLCVEDDRCVKRIANIESAIGHEKSLNEDKIIEARNQFRTPGQVYLYCNATVATQLQLLAKNKSNVHWSENNPFGKPQLYFVDMPIRICDAITNSESDLT